MKNKIASWLTRKSPMRRQMLRLSGLRNKDLLKSIYILWYIIEVYPYYNQAYRGSPIVGMRFRRSVFNQDYEEMQHHKNLLIAQKKKERARKKAKPSDSEEDMGLSLFDS